MTKDRHAGHEGSLNYHQRMLADPHRVVAYERAIRALVRPGDVVLDLGAGTGLLSILAARRGARVHAVESMGVATWAADIIRRNGLADRITVHHADVRALAVPEPVDLVVSDFMGRFIVDDYMLEALAAARRWLKPDGVFCPRGVTMRVAPAALGHMPALDTWVAPLVGVDLTPLALPAMHEAYGADVPPHAILATPAVFATLDPLRGGERFDAALSFVVARPGRLRALVGWFDVDLAPGVALTTEPGAQTHWSQLVFPLPAVAVAAHDVVDAHLRLEVRDGEYVWRWSGEVRRGEAVLARFDLDASEGDRAPDPEPPAPTPFLTGDAIDALNDAGAEAFARADYAAAIDAFERAVAGLRPEHDEAAANLYENLGLAYAHAGAWVPAVPAFLRALDGDPASREQSARFLVEACFNSSRHSDGARFLADYERHFGAHPRSRAEQGRPT